MNTSVSRFAPQSFSSSFTAGALACLSFVLAGCLDGGDGETAQQGTSSGPAGSIVAHPTGGLGSRSFIVDPNRSGNGTNLRIQGVFWGRLVTVTDSTDTVQHLDYVIGEDVSDNSDYQVTTNPVTEITTLKIKHPAGSAAYTAALLRADDNLIPIQRKSLSPNELPPFSLAPRNAAIVIQFDDLLGFYFDEGLDNASALDDSWRDFAGGNLINAGGQVNSSSVQVLTGNPPTASFSSRVFPDPNHGDRADFDGDGLAEFFPTRLIVDATTSEIEAASVLPALLSPNSLGLPASVTTQLPNVAIRIPTEPAGPVTTPLHNPTSPLHTIARDTLENIDFASPTLDAVRAMRSGGSSDVTGDVNNGFLSDEEGPRIVGSQQIEVSSLAPDAVAGPDFFRFTMTYELGDCASTPKVGDVIRQLGTFAEVTESPGAPIGAVVSNVQARVIFPLGASLSEVPSTFLTTFDPVNDATIPIGCFASFSPPALDPPTAGISPAAQITLRFTEAMDPASVLPFDSMTLTRIENDSDPDPFDFIVGDVVASPDLREFTFVPTLPLTHTAGSTEDYFLRLAPGSDGPTDLAGNTLVDELPEMEFTLDTNATTEETGGVVMRFNEASELDNEMDPTMPTREIRGQILFDTNLGRILSRPVTRTSLPADSSQPTPSVMTAFPGGVQTPLSPLGSKLQTLWRYIDLGMSATDESTHNIDVEGLSWTPATGAALFDFYDNFEIRLSHSRRQPDEILDQFGFPEWPASGVQKTYNNNILTPNDSPQVVVHPRDLGYVVSPGDQFTSESGTAMMPYPLNREGPISEYRYYTWRDNAILGRGGPSGEGVPLGIEEQVLGLDNPPTVYGPNQVQAVALPLLMEYRCYPRDGAQGLNGFMIALAVGSSSTPNFRAFSTGGTGTGGNPITRNPDLESTARGGFNPNSNPPGQSTNGVDNSFYFGQIDLVTRVSRAHTIWFDLANEVDDITVNSPIYMDPVIDPKPEDQPSGTQVLIDFRGASNVTMMDGTRDALSLDTYGDGANPAFVGGQTWKSSISQIDGARYFQTRFTFIANTETGLTPTISAFGVAFQQ